MKGNLARRRHDARTKGTTPDTGIHWRWRLAGCHCIAIAAGAGIEMQRLFLCTDDTRFLLSKTHCTWVRGREGERERERESDMVRDCLDRDECFRVGQEKRAFQKYQNAHFVSK